MDPASHTAIHRLWQTCWPSKGVLRSQSLPVGVAHFALQRHPCLAACWVCVVVVSLSTIIINEAAAASGDLSTPSGQPQQLTCASEQHPVTPFPTSFWLVKTIKTGGTTLAGVLRHICGHYGVVPVNKRRINPLERLSDEAAAAGLQQLVQGAKNMTDASEFAIITHINFSDAKLAAFQSVVGGRRPLLFTSVRNPLTRTYSHYIQAKCAAAAAMLGGKIIQCDTNTTYMDKLLSLDNIRNRWNFVHDTSRHNLMYKYVKGNATSPEAALAKYDFVFVSERMDEGEGEGPLVVPLQASFLVLCGCSQPAARPSRLTTQAGLLYMQALEWSQLWISADKGCWGCKHSRSLVAPST